VPAEPAPEPGPDAPLDEVPLPEVKELSEQGIAAIRNGLKWLARHQQPDGSFKAHVGFKRNSGYAVTKTNAGHPGVTALAGMAFLAGGHVPGRGLYGDQVKRVVKYLLKSVNPDGMIAANGTRMYSHAFATLFLAEVYGMTGDAKVKRGLSRAVQFTWKCQNAAGGWRYLPFDQDSDMSITVCQVMALRAARNIGIKVPKESIDRAVNYVLRSAVTGSRRDAGSFRYRFRTDVPVPTRSSYALTAAGLATLYMAGLYGDEDIQAHIRDHRLEPYIRGAEPPRIETILGYLRSRYASTRPKHYFFYYGNYYAVQAMFNAGGKAWEDYFGRVQRDLVSWQRPDGSWPISSVGDTYATASACLILQVPYRYLPIFER
jgi:hypothetical protein